MEVNDVRPRVQFIGKIEFSPTPQTDLDGSLMSIIRRNSPPFHWHSSVLVRRTKSTVHGFNGPLTHTLSARCNLRTSIVSDILPTKSLQVHPSIHYLSNTLPILWTILNDYRGILYISYENDIYQEPTMLDILPLALVYGVFSHLVTQTAVPGD